MVKELKLDKSKIISQLNTLRANPGSWMLEYDPTIDQLFFGMSKIPKGSFLYQLNDEINIYIDKNSKLSGMFVEYFKNNYLEHNQELKPVLSVLEGSDQNSNQVQDIERVALEKDLFLGAFTSLFERDELVTAIA